MSLKEMSKKELIEIIDSLNISVGLLKRHNVLLKNRLSIIRSWRIHLIHIKRKIDYLLEHPYAVNDARNRK